MIGALKNSGKALLRRAQNLGPAPRFDAPVFPEAQKFVSMLSPPERDKLKQELLAISDWYNPFILDGQEVKLKGAWMRDFHNYRKGHIFRNFQARFGKLDGLSVLDIGSNEGFYSFAARELGAAPVKGLDLRQENVERANKIRDFFGYTDCTFETGSITEPDLSRLGQFDVVLCFGVFYHLENPMIAVRNLRKLTKKILVVDSVLTSFDPRPIVHVGTEPVACLRAGETGVVFTPTLGGLVEMLKAGGFNVDVVPATRPAFWSPDCNHDYRQSQSSLFCT